MKLATPKQMQNIDRYAIDTLGVPGLELMETAGARVVETIDDFLDDISEQSVCIVCGKGNNGGDGFVVGRLLKDKGAIIKIFLIGILYIDLKKRMYCFLVIFLQRLLLNIRRFLVE